MSVDLKSLPVSLDVTDQMDDKQKMLMLQLALKVCSKPLDSMP